MSALWAPVTDRAETGVEPPGRTRLRSVPRPASRLARFPFLLVLIGVFGLGMAGLLMLNTTLQNQAFDSRTLNRQATELTYVQADLENQLTVLGAPQELARRASAMGMRTNPYPALLQLPSGKVSGKPTPVKGSEMQSQIVKTPAEQAAEKAAAAAKKVADAKKKAAEEKAQAEEAKRKAKEAVAKEAEAKKAEAKKAEAATKAESAKKKTTSTDRGQG